ncbi:heme oxygenase-like protein [Ramaria rubella]|nr:heme oxygenase-like protein [Ramaria rubella]
MVSRQAQIHTGRALRFTGVPNNTQIPGAKGGTALPSLGASDDPNDLVALLYQDPDNQAKWNKMINNEFVQKLAKAKKDDQAVLEGFNWYMTQDYFYLLELARYDAVRASEAPIKDVPTQLNKAIKRLGDAEKYLDETLVGALGLDKAKVKDAPHETATKDYTEWEKETAEDLDWNTSKAIMIPCILGYYEIATKLKATPGIPTDTAWYKNWIEPNLDESYVEEYRQFFIKLGRDWKKESDYANFCRIFRERCQCETDLWNVALNPQKV